MSKFVPKFKKNRFEDDYDSKDRNHKDQKSTGRQAKAKMRDMLNDTGFQVESKRR